jgi:PAS domain S-box-containing protein
MTSDSLFQTANLHELLVREVVDYAIFMLDPGGHVVTWNAGAVRIKGYAEADIVGRHFSVFYTPEDRAAGMPGRALATALETGRFTAEGWRCRKDGSRFWAMVAIDPIHDRGRFIGFAKITRDLTERREAQLALEASREQLFQAQKMEAVGQLTGGLAHDFNNLLTGIIGSLSLMENRLAAGQTADFNRYITAALGAASRAAGLTHRLLSFARRQTLDPVLVEIEPLIGGMRDLLQRTAGQGIRFETDFAPALWPISCDANQLESAILNLCINARDAMPGGGLIHMAAANTTLGPIAAERQRMPPGDYVAICVNDTGTGMPPEVLARAFDPFFTTKPVGQGTGLGLSMIHGFAKQSGGQATIRSAPGAGTTVCILLPRSEGGARVAERARAPGAAPSGDATAPTRPAHILIVDDEPTIRLLVSEILRGLGHGVSEVADGAAGLALLSAGQPVDLLISDIGLPGEMNGRQMVARAREIHPRLKVLFITGYAEAQTLNGLTAPPDTEMLAKPFSIDALTTRVQQLLQLPSAQQGEGG